MTTEAAGQQDEVKADRSALQLGVDRALDKMGGGAGDDPSLDALIERHGTVSDIFEFKRALRAGPRVAGFSTDLWTLPRVAEVIERLTQVRYHPGHVWRLLRGLNWSLQRPPRRARERDETT